MIDAGPPDVGAVEQIEKELYFALRSPLSASRCNGSLGAIKSSKWPPGGSAGKVRVRKKGAKIVSEPGQDPKITRIPEILRARPSSGRANACIARASAMEDNGRPQQSHFGTNELARRLTGSTEVHRGYRLIPFELRSRARTAACRPFRHSKACSGRDARASCATGKTVPWSASGFMRGAGNGRNDACVITPCCASPNVLPS